MKSIVSILLLFLTFTSCMNEQKPPENITSAVQDRGISDIIIPNPGNSDSGRISVVYPRIPEMELTVGGEGADIRGFTSRSIQTAIDAIHLNGGGTVILLPGTYDIIAPVHLYSNMMLKGSGNKTVLKKCKGYRSAFALDADYGELQVTAADASGFSPGMGVAIYDDNQRGGWAPTTTVITKITGNVIYLRDFLLLDYTMAANGTITNACPVIEAISADNVVISDLTVDGSKETNDLVDGCRAGGIYLHKVHKATVENVTVKDFNCDGISWQITEYVTVRNCEVFGCTNAGLHPGTGSPYTVMEGNNSHDNGGFGLFVCWRVRDGLVKNNKFHHNKINGICTGHKDTAMIFEGNYVYQNGSDGINLRGETDLNAPHGTVIRNNVIENNGTDETGYGIAVNSKAKGVLIEGNTIRNTGSGKQAAAVLLTKNSLPVEMKNNAISGHPKGEVVKE